jgi:hypothetical protein
MAEKEKQSLEKKPEDMSVEELEREILQVEDALRISGHSLGLTPEDMTQISEAEKITAPFLEQYKKLTGKDWYALPTIGRPGRPHNMGRGHN